MEPNKKAIRSGSRFLVFGKTGWIGGLLGEILTERGFEWAFADSRLENRQDLIQEVDKYKPTHILNAAGLTGRPNVDWCEDHKEEVIRVNVCGCLNLADVCVTKGIHCLIFATGCIYEYDENHLLGSGVGFTEEDVPNFTGSFYSKTKGLVESLLREYKENVCVLRVRMPISSDLQCKRNFIFKIKNYAKIVNIPNSMTVLDELLPFSIEMSLSKLKSAPSPNAKQKIGIFDAELYCFMLSLIFVPDVSPSVGSPSVRKTIICCVPLPISLFFLTSFAKFIAAIRAPLMSVPPSAYKFKIKSLASLTFPFLLGIL